MGQFAAAGALIAALSASAAMADAPANNTALNIMKSTAAVQAGKCDEALPALEALWNDPEFQAADPDTAEQFRFERILCTLTQNGAAAAMALSAENEHHAGASIASYDLHTFLLLSTKQIPAAAANVEEALTRFPDTASKLADMTVMATLLAVQDETTRYNLLNHLERVRWQIHDPSARLIIDTLRLHGLRAAVAAGDHGLAELYRADMAPDGYMYALIEGDGRLTDASVPAAPVQPVVRAQINEVKAYIASRPTDLLGLEYLIGLERSDDDHEVALVQLSGILTLIAQNGLQKFEQPNAYPSLIADKAQLLLDLQRAPEALTVFKEGTERMRGPGTIDFVIAYMNALIDTGQEKDALALESHITLVAMNASQKRALAATEACAFAYMKDTARYALSLSASADAHGIAAIKPYLCAGDMDGAAAALIARINDPASRDQAILLMQDVKPQVPHSVRDRDYVNAIAALRKRPDVLAAAKAQDIVVRAWPLRFEQY
ncbi:hypothetical protein [Asticcacaulis solisilvae]|uniref:hypothetical protein n=1 Tax=Asticcacaulis solisilvae TaxID=1217274 RepID=UPI003FD87AFC